MENLHAKSKEELIEQIHRLTEDKKIIAQAIDSQTDTFFVFNPETGKAIQWNKAFSTLSGYSHKEIAKLPAPISYYSKDDLNKASKFINEIKNKQTGIIELTLICKDGSKIPTEYNVSAINDPNGTPKYFISIGRDIRDRIKIKKELKKREAFLNSVIDQNPYAMWISDNKGNLLRTNKAYCDLLVLTTENLIENYNILEDKTVKEQGVLDHVKAVFQKGKIAHFNLRYNSKTKKNSKRKNNIGLFLEVTIAPITNSKGKVTNAIVICNNITEQKQVEHKFLESEENLLDAQKMSHLGYWKWDVTTGNCEWNAETYKIFHLDPDEFTPQLDSIMKLSPWPEDNARDQEIIQRAIDKKEQGFFEQRFLRPDGSTGFYSSTFRGIWNDQGELITMVGTILDITEQKKIEQELRKAKEKAEESDTLKTAFLANMSHEIRTPMNGILGFADLLKSPELTSDQQQKYIDIIEQSGNRMLSIIHDLIDISKIETDQVEIIKEKTELNQIMDNLHSFFKPEADKKELELYQSAPLTEEECIIETDKTKLSQILTNLIGNAIKFTSTGQIKFGYTKENDNLLFYVKDTGEGVPFEMQDIIFERFRQADTAPSKVVEGTGLGLPISKAFVEKMGGTIWLESIKGKGSSFYFRLPYIKPKNKVQLPNIKHNFAENMQKDLTVLVAEDDEISFQYLKELLSQANINVLHAPNGVEVIKLCKLHDDINLILMDIKMPILNGLEATEQVKKINAKLPVIAQSAYVSIKDKIKAKEAGCDAYVEKPIDKDDLFSLIEKYTKDKI
ncbi:PAS domain S-box protein [Labilibaculum sp. DW002]|uniref:histidine kinase n=1 Tax=Paralabilibaculum antarcticum TaxID=2912572 RepID=A0ABT5VXZ1_9BACT|nr:PAS domain S-box protein [Labilibaculum sp. DW002]MDE5419652.1 PAS domain S-box protein [Labilibaculum sp. DW002]